MAVNFRRTAGSFSTLYGSKWVATSTLTLRQLTGQCFSTLYGSKWVATLVLRSPICQFCKVSVPSTGRSGLQQRRWRALLLDAAGFSTLYGSKWVATRHFVLPQLIQNMFQYPLRVEVGCNAMDKPRRDALSRRFSTLYGSKWVATLEERCELLYSLQGFSTLYGSKWVATQRQHPHQRPHPHVSVPSTGRSGLQLQEFALKALNLGVSVPSTGRSGLQLRYGRRLRISFEGFSTLYGSKWVATTPFRCSCCLKTVFQYPLRVEVGCNPVQCWLVVRLHP